MNSGRVRLNPAAPRTWFGDAVAHAGGPGACAHFPLGSACPLLLSASASGQGYRDGTAELRFGSPGGEEGQKYHVQAVRPLGRTQAKPALRSANDVLFCLALQARSEFIFLDLHLDSTKPLWSRALTTLALVTMAPRYDSPPSLVRIRCLYCSSNSCPGPR